MEPKRVHKSKLRRWRLPLGALVLGLLFSLLLPLPAAYRDLHADLSLRLTDREGRPLRTVLSQRQGTDRWIPLEKMPPVLVQAVIASEDRRFYAHPGLDPLAIARAVQENLSAGTVVSGASTLTQQLLRTLTPPGERSWRSKLSEAFWALRLELRTNKDELLEAYLNRVAFGPSVYGAEEAARYYFNKPAASLSLAESALLAVMIRAPVTFDPFTDEGRVELKVWTGDLLSRMLAQGTITEDAAQRAKDEPWALSEAPPPFLAPHFCDLVLPQLLDKRGEQRTSLDLPLQRAIEGMIANHLHLLASHKVTNAAVLVVDVATGEVLAMAGSADFHRGHDGQHNAAVSLRQPGSTLKPFTYAMLMERVGQAGFILPDLPLYTSSKLGGFIPDNYDGRFHGPVSVRTALGSSYNVPAVKALERVGVEPLLGRLRGLGMHDLTETPEHYGLGLTLGDGSVSLWQLVEAYRTLARGGVHGALTLLRDSATVQQGKSFDPRVAYLITDVLSDRKARVASFGSPNVLEFPFPCAVKTGTSKGYRDNWCLGYTPRVAVGVWVGNSDGTPMLDVSGITGAGPLFRDVMLLLGDGGDFSRPPDLEQRKVCALSGHLADEDCSQTVVEWALPEMTDEKCAACVMTSVDLRTGEPATSTTPPGARGERLRYRLDPIYATWAGENGLPTVEVAARAEDGFRLVYPRDDDVFLLDHEVRPENQKVRLHAVGGRAPYRWSVDGVALPGAAGLEVWWKLRPGKHTVKIADASGVEDSLVLTVIGKPSSAPLPCR